MVRLPLTYHSNLKLNNFKKFKQYVKHICIQVNPMPMNYHEMIDYVKFCDDNDVYLAFNIIRYPKDCSLIFDKDLEKKWEEMKAIFIIG